MAFLRLKRAKRSVRLEQRSNGKYAPLDFLGDECSTRLDGKLFTTRKRCAEYGFRVATGGFTDGKPIEVRSMKARGKASMATRKVSAGAAGACFKVREQMPGLWRRYQFNDADKQWRWLSDHTSQEDALAGRKALADIEMKADAPVHVQSGAEYD